MKKTTFIVLTLVASVSITLGAAISASAQDPDPVYPQYYVEPEKREEEQRDTIPSDSLSRDTVYIQQNVSYNYYYRNPFWNGMYRFWFPTRYYRAISRPGYIPRHIRGSRRDGSLSNAGKHSRGAGRRGGFGSLGTHSTSN